MQISVEVLGEKGNKMEFIRNENESVEELIYRICSCKDTIGTWEQVKEILNELLGVNYGESKYRKQFQNFEKMLKANQQKFIDSDEKLSLLEEKENKIREERIKLQALNVERNRYDRAMYRQELYYEYVGKMINGLPMPEFEPLQVEYGGMEYLCTISDVHFGATFESENNCYSPTICKQRFERLVTHLRGFVLSKKIRKLHIAMLGDSLQGLLRVSDLKLNDSEVVKATVDFSRTMALFLREVSKFVEVVYYHVPSANHTQTRNLGTKASELASEDLEYVISNYIHDLCESNERIDVRLAEEGKQYVEIDIFDYDILAMHGHQIKSFSTAIKDLSAMRRKFVDYLILGHFHSGQELPANESAYYDTEVLISPSFIGSDPYSDTLFKGNKAAVKMYGFDEYKGHTETYKVILN